MGTPLGPKYIPYTYMEFFGKARESATNPKPGLTREEVCLCAEALIAGYPKGSMWVYGIYSGPNGVPIYLL